MAARLHGLRYSISAALSTVNQRARRGLILSASLLALYWLCIGNVLPSTHQNWALASPADDASAKLTPSAMLPLNEANALCSAHEMPVYMHRANHRKIYDLFLINSELDWLEIRLNELNGQVDYFVILEANQAFTKLPKPMYFKENYHLFSNFSDKIIYHALDLSERDTDPWDREHHTRNAMFTHVFPHLLPPRAPMPDDVLLVSDIDEIPRPDTLKVLRNCDFPQRTTLRSRFYYYSFQWLHVGDEWHHPQATFFTTMADTIRPEDLRMGGGWDFNNASWHCSSCFGTVKEMVNKIESFSHQEYNQPLARDPVQIVHKVRNGIDLFDRKGENYTRTAVTDVPKFLASNSDRFGYMVDRDPNNANFVDYEADDD